MIPAAAGITDFKTVIGAATGASALALKLYGINTSILHAELAGLVTALILSNQSQDAQNGCITLLPTTSILYDSYMTTSPQSIKNRGFEA
jgi:hypothetical protein